ncbi:MAG: hypothetical protein HKN25_15190 [Pyrinomonadaceae bacterium]|nr:hypothetical protein [Pyrinomonadaceae bacterium]
MKKFLFLVIAILMLIALANGAASDDLADEVLSAHGGAKYVEMKSLIVRGSVDITASVVNQAIPATFVTIFAGDKYRLEIDNPFQPFKQVFDGQQTYSSIERGFTLPPINRIGMPLLQKLGSKGFETSDLANKKKRGFRITAPDGYFTDFYISKKTNRVKAYEASYIVNDRDVTTSVEIDKYQEVDGVVIPKKYAQRFDVSQMTVYAEFKAREILVNTQIDDDVFSLE